MTETSTPPEPGIVRGRHFELQMVPAGKWKRLGNKVPEGIKLDNDHPRPHAVALTDEGHGLIRRVISGGAHHGCPGVINCSLQETILGTTCELLALRWVFVAPGFERELIEELDQAAMALVAG